MGHEDGRGDGRGEIEWLDDDGHPAAPDEELPGQNRPPLSRRTKIVFVVVAAIALAATIVAGVVLGPDDTAPKAAAPTPSVSAPSISGTSVSGTSVSGMSAAVAPAPDNGHRGPPPAALTAIRTAFPGAALQSFVSVAPKATESRATLFYNLSLAGRSLTVRVTPLRRTDIDLVNRNAKSIELGQQLRDAFIDITVTAGTGKPRASDFDAMQNLIQDIRLLTPQ